MTEERYEIRGKIGQGGVGAVYKAYDTQLRREVAIKRVLADEEDGDNELATQNLLKEATALSSVQHPHICTVYDSGIDDEGPFVVMEYINGKTLDQMVEKGTLTYEDFREVAIQSEEALIAAQELNIVHRDLKPSNVMVSWLPSGRFQIKLVDFGLAKFSAKPSLQTIDHGDAVFGSIFFMAPEQFERTPLDQRTDMYSLGAMFYFVLTGNYPFDGDSAAQVMASHLQGSVVPLQQIRPDLPVWLCEWVMWHIQRDVNNRPNSAKDALEKFLADESLAAQGGLGATQQLVTPAIPKAATVPLLIPSTGAQTVKAPSSHGVTSATAPQPVLTPTGQQTTNTSTQRLQATGPTTTTSPQSQTPATIAGAGAALGTAPTQTQPYSATQTTTTDEATVIAMQKKPVSKAKLIVIFSMLIVAIIIASIILVSKGKENEENKTYNRLTDDIQSKEELPVTEDELNILLEAVSGHATLKNRNQAYAALSKAKSANDSFSVTLKTAKFAVNEKSNLNSESRKNIFKAVSLNKPYNAEAFKLMLEYAQKHPNEPAAEQAVGQLKRQLSDDYFDNVIDIHDNTKTLNIRTKCVNTIIALVEASKNKKGHSKTLIAHYKSANDNIKLSYLRMMGATGTKEALAILTEQLKSNKPIHVQAATRGLSKWPNLKPFPALVDAYATSEPGASKRILSDIRTFFHTNEKASDDKKINMWIQLIEAAPDKREEYQLTGTLTTMKSEISTQALKHISTMPKYNERAKALAAKELKKRKKK